MLRKKKSEKSRLQISQGFTGRVGKDAGVRVRGGGATAVTTAPPTFQPHMLSLRFVSPGKSFCHEPPPQPSQTVIRSQKRGRQLRELAWLLLSLILQAQQNGRWGG